MIIPTFVEECNPNILHPVFHDQDVSFKHDFQRMIADIGQIVRNVLDVRYQEISHRAAQQRDGRWTFEMRIDFSNQSNDDAIRVISAILQYFKQQSERMLLAFP